MKFKLFWTALCLTFAQAVGGQAIAPGQTDTAGLATCFDFMGNVNFSSTYRFITGYTGNTKPGGWNGDKINDQKYRVYDFSIPLVADLDGDGYPEIIALGIPDGTSGGDNGNFNNIQIYNGQSGKIISQLPLPGLTSTGSGSYRHSAYHGSPCPMAIVDSDRDGFKELIFAFPRDGGDSKYRNKLVSLNLFPVTINNSSTAYMITEKWLSNDPYNADIGNDYHKPLPTVVDLDGDGKAEVVVYNRIYDAATGRLLSNLEGSASFKGADAGAYGNDVYLGFNYVYDMDLDGIYDIVAGGKIYKMQKLPDGTFFYTLVSVSGVPDGRTGVADINGDGSPDVVVVTRTSGTVVRITVWNPGFSNGGSSSNPAIIADQTITMGNGLAGNSGSNSYVFIGDIDGRVQEPATGRKYRLPEIAILGGQFNYGSISPHPNVPANSFPTTGNTPSNTGALVAVTWDAASGLNANKRLKLSFVMEHEDLSVNTGFTMFDFDNDAQQEICYRDENNLRIIKPIKPFVKASEAVSAVGPVLFSRTVRSYTGFEYPVIADIDNDASAEIIVTGRNETRAAYYAFIYAVGPSGDKFAPALKVWNQFMYDPFKINPDSLTTPIGPAPNRLSQEFTYTRVVRNEKGTVIKTIEKYQPYNATLSQDMHFKNSQGAVYDNIEPIIFLTEACFVTGGTDKPTITGTSTANGKITIYVGNKSTAKADVNANTPISIYQDSVSKARFVKKVTLAQCGFTGGSIKAGGKEKIEITGINPAAIYVLRLGDDSDLSGTNENWHYGVNPPANNNTTNHTGPSMLSYRDCDWSDQEIRIARFMTNDDIYTLQEYGSVEIDLLGNDIIPDDASIDIQAGVNGQLTSQPVAGDIVYLSGNKIRYTHNAKANLEKGVESFQYKIAYTSNSVTTERTGTVYIFLLQSHASAFASCYGEDYEIRLKELPAGVLFYWSAGPSTPEEATPHSSLHLPEIKRDTVFYIRPIPVAAPYSAIAFPRGKLRVSVVPEKINGKAAVLKWTGAANTDWFNPNNWSDNAGKPVAYAPIACVDVILPEGKSRYPALSRAGSVHNIDLKNRAMLGNISRLTYNAASFELKLTAGEQNRWIMYSSPFAKTYSGDFMLRGKDGYPVKKAVYMSFFQEANPDNSAETAAVHCFTQSFGKADEELTLGKGFIMYVDGTRVKENTSFQFPSPVDQYEYYYDDEYITYKKQHLPDTFSGVLDRGNPAKNNRFITEADTVIYSDATHSNLYMVVNPFCAFLDVDKLMSANAASFTPNRFYIWGGAEATGFISFQKNGNRWIVGNPGAMPQTPSPFLLPPYQALFVLKKNPAPVTSIILSESWTKTEGSNYALRSGQASAAEGDAWYVHVSSGELSAYTALFASEETVCTPALFFDADGTQSLDVYTIDNHGKAASITGFSAGTQEIPLGLRLKQSGDVELGLHGLNEEKYQVYLKDGDRLIDLSGGKKYKTGIVRPANANKAYFEVNERFSLHIKKK